jgi:hypothetical protein
VTEIPYVPKRNVTLIAIADPLEATAVRAVLEGLNYRTTSHWVGSRAEAIKLLTGEIPTDQVVIVSCHGDEHGILLPDEDPITPGDVRDHACLEGKTVVNLGCCTGSDDLSAAFRAAGTTSYVAPVDSPDGAAALAFVSNLFFLHTYGVPLDEAVRRAAGFHPECEQFRLF